MISVSYCSDLHLEHLLKYKNGHAFFLEAIANAEPADILVLAGDIVEARMLAAVPESSHYEVAERSREIFTALSQKFSKVIYIMGNHEHYHGNINRSRGIIEQFTEHLGNFVVLENDELIINDTAFFGCTLWSDCGPVSDHWFISKGIADYRLIKSGEGPTTRNISVAQTIAMHNNSVALINSFLTKHADKTCVVLTHHAPHRSMVSEFYLRQSNNYINHAFYTDLSYIFETFQNLKFWVSGHTHHSTIAEICGTVSGSNSLGYAGSEVSADEIKGFTFNRFEC